MDIDIIISLIFFATLFGTNKLAAVVGTATSAVSFARKVRFEWKLLAVVAVCATISSFWGAASVAMIPKEVLQPFVLVMLIVMAVYTLMKKQFGQVHMAQRVTPKILLLAGIGSLAIGFYDGLFGPGTGSFFIFYFIRYLRVDFLHAAALAKIGNVMTNLAALSFFIPSGHVLFAVGGTMAVANMIGSICGVKMALKYGSGFIRILFLILVTILILRLSYQMFLM